MSRLHQNKNRPVIVLQRWLVHTFLLRFSHSKWMQTAWMEMDGKLFTYKHPKFQHASQNHARKGERINASTQVSCSNHSRTDGSQMYHFTLKTKVRRQCGIVRFSFVQFNLITSGRHVSQTSRHHIEDASEIWSLRSELEAAENITMPACLLLRASYLPRFSSCWNTVLQLILLLTLNLYKTKKWLKVNISTFTNTVNSNIQYTALLTVGKDFLGECCLTRNTTNYAFICLWQILS